MNTTRNAPKLDFWLPEAAEFYRPPPAAEQFDPHGSWQQNWVMLDNAPNRSIRKIQPEGFLRMRRNGPGQAGRFSLDVELVARRQHFGSFRTTIQMQCLSDRLGTPQSWKTRTTSLDVTDQPVDATRVDESGRVEEGMIIRNGRRAGKVSAPRLLSSNWSLFDAVQRLGGERIEPVRFDMLEDLDLMKPNQRLSYWGTTEVELRGNTVRLVGYQQIGEGILPYHYWLDESSRLILVYGGLRGFLFNPQAEQSLTPPRRKA